MEKELVELFCNVKSEEKARSEDKALLYLHSVFLCFFVLVNYVILYVEIRSIRLFLIPCTFLCAELLFVIFYFKLKTRYSIVCHYLFQGCLNLSISLMWLSIVFVYIFAKDIRFPFIWVISTVLGGCFLLLFMIFRYLKYKKIQAKKMECKERFFNPKMSSIALIAVLISGYIIKGLEKDVQNSFLTGGLIILFFVFITISVNEYICFWLLRKADVETIR